MGEGRTVRSSQAWFSKLSWRVFEDNAMTTRFCSQLNCILKFCNELNIYQLKSVSLTWHKHTLK
jgi:Asp-tRNA(Asn)/Glu-tRNA(Gln) amidotransferase C subunit